MDSPKGKRKGKKERKKRQSKKKRASEEVEQDEEQEGLPLATVEDVTPTITDVTEEKPSGSLDDFEFWLSESSTPDPKKIAKEEVAPTKTPPSTEKPVEVESGKKTKKGKKSKVRAADRVNSCFMSSLVLDTYSGMSEQWTLWENLFVLCKEVVLFGRS